jgi:hypothetical protein
MMTTSVLFCLIWFRLVGGPIHTGRYCSQPCHLHLCHPKGDRTTLKRHFHELLITRSSMPASLYCCHPRNLDLHHPDGNFKGTLSTSFRPHCPQLLKCPLRSEYKQFYTTGLLFLICPILSRNTNF